MTPENDTKVATGRGTRRRMPPIRCSICTSLIWLRYHVLKEPSEAPEPRHEWTLCQPCHSALLAEMRRSPIRSSVRLRVAVGLVAAERSPGAYTNSSVGASMHEQQEFQREFAWAIRLLILFALWHLVILIILFAVPK